MLKGKEWTYLVKEEVRENSQDQGTLVFFVPLLVMLVIQDTLQILDMYQFSI